MELQNFTSSIQAPASAPTSLEVLARMKSRELGELFGEAPSGSLEQIRGNPRGRMLTVPGFDRGPVAGFLRWYAASSLIVWEGKSFASAPLSDVGHGFNRVRLFGRRRAFPFRTFRTPSVVDGKPALAISYDVPENPAIARATYDELRHLGDGLYLGRGMRKRPTDEPKLLVWFALDSRHQDRDVDAGGLA